jgi:hypothetical protein
MQKQFAMPVCAHTAGESLSPTDSDCGTERNGARAGGQRSRGHAQRSEVKRSEPDGVRLVWRRAVCDFQPSEAAAERSQSASRNYTWIVIGGGGAKSSKTLARKV